MNRKPLAILLCTFFFMVAVQAQQNERVIFKPIDSAIVEMEGMVKGKIPGKARLVGIGDVAPLAFEPVRFNTALAAYLISKKGFQNVLLFHDNWMLRNFNDYLTGKRAFDSTVVDSLMEKSLANFQYRMYGFRAFLLWLKKYNLAHPDKIVALKGVSTDHLIPVSYLMVTYVYPVDKGYGTTLAQKIGSGNFPDSLAYKEMDAWCQGFLKKTSLDDKTRKLLAECSEDLEHNRTILSREKVRDNKEYAGLMFTAIVQRILKNTDKKSIFYATNEFIARAAMQADYYPGSPTFTGPGMYLHRQLKDKYFTCLTAFADTANVNLVDVQHSKFVNSVRAAPKTVAEMWQVKDKFFLAEDINYVKYFIPQVIPALVTLPTTIVPDGNTAPADALFLFNRLTPAIGPK